MRTSAPSTSSSTPWAATAITTRSASAASEPGAKEAVAAGTGVSKSGVAGVVSPPVTRVIVASGVPGSEIATTRDSTMK